MGFVIRKSQMLDVPVFTETLIFSSFLMTFDFFAFYVFDIA